MSEQFTAPVHLPVGTPAEVEAAGESLDMVASCAQPNKATGMRGCPYWKTCMFGKKALGGFKGKSGPHWIGYELKTSNADGGHRKEDITSCFGFVASGLQSRMLAGIDRRNRGLDHEIVRVIAQEGEEIVYRKWVLVDPNNPKNYKMKSITAPLVVPKFRRPGENPEESYEQKMAARSKRRDSIEADIEDMVTEEMMQAREPVDDGELIDAGTVLAQPVKETPKK